MAELKTKPNQGDVEAFLESIENEQRKADCLKLLEVMKSVTKEEPVMWGGSIVGFGQYHYVYASGREGDWFRVGFSPRKQNLSIHIMPGLDSHEDLLAELGKFNTGRGCLYVKKLDDIHLPSLKKIIRAALKELKTLYG